MCCRRVVLNSQVLSLFGLSSIWCFNVSMERERCSVFLNEALTLRVGKRVVIGIGYRGAKGRSLNTVVQWGFSQKVE